jgi:hypothetical protein
MNQQDTQDSEEMFTKEQAKWEAFWQGEMSHFMRQRGRYLRGVLAITG